MKKNGIILALAVLWMGCEESTPVILFNTLELQDTAFVLSQSEIPEAEYRGILVEDVTGVRCVACPNAAEVASQIKKNATTNPVVVFGLYPTGLRALTEPFKDFEDLRTEVSQSIGDNIYQFTSLPAGGVNRKIFDGETKRNIPFSTWASRANSFNGEKSVANLNVKIDQVDSDTFIVNTDIVFTKMPDAEPFVSVFLLENNIIHPQDFIPNTIPDYSHQHVVRKAYTPYNGIPLIKDQNTTMRVGLKVLRGWKIVIPDGVDINEASIAVFLNYNDNENREVFQCTEESLK